MGGLVFFSDQILESWWQRQRANCKIFCHPVMKRIGRRPQNVISCVSKLMNIASLSIKIGCSLGV